MLARIDIVTVVLGVVIALLMGNINAEAEQFDQAASTMVIIINDDHRDVAEDRPLVATRSFTSVEELLEEIGRTGEAVILFEPPRCLPPAHLLINAKTDWEIADWGVLIGMVVPVDKFAGISSDSLDIAIELGGKCKPFPVKKGCLTFVDSSLLINIGPHGEGYRICVITTPSEFYEATAIGYVRQKY